MSTISGNQGFIQDFLLGWGKLYTGIPTQLGGSGGIPPQENFEIWGLLRVILRHFRLLLKLFVLVCAISNCLIENSGGEIPGRPYLTYCISSKNSAPLIFWHLLTKT